jgi:hypothetical protein
MSLNGPREVLVERLIMERLTKKLGKLSIMNCSEFGYQTTDLRHASRYNLYRFLKEIGITKTEFYNLLNKIKGVKTNGKEKRSKK